MVTDETLVSIIVPVYNTEKYINRCVDSILAQSYHNIEIILVDDGSVDNSGKICDRYAENYSNITVIHKSNGGISETRNIGMQKAKGSIIAFVDSDDCIDRRMIEVCMNEKVKSSADIVGFFWKFFSDTVPESKFKGKVKIIKKKRLVPFFLTKNHLYCSVRYLYDKRIIEDHHLAFDSQIRSGGEDQLFIYNYVRHCNSAAMLSYDGYFYFNNIQSVSSGMVKPNHYNDLQVRKFILDDCSKNCKSRAKIHLLKGYLAFCLKAIKYGNACEEDIVSKYRTIVKKNLLSMVFSPYLEFKYKAAAGSLACSVSLTKRLLKKTQL